MYENYLNQNSKILKIEQYGVQLKFQTRGRVYTQTGQTIITLESFEN
jgi:hypothetical protein